MSISMTTGARRFLVAVAAATAMLAAAAQAAPAQAAPARVARPAGLHITGPVPIGEGTFFADPIAEAPNGAVYFAAGPAVYVVHGLTPLKLVLIATGTVVGVGVNSTELFVEVGKTVTEYKRSDQAAGRHWHLSSPEPVTSAGLDAVGNTVWSWTDWATGDSGAELATISRFTTSSGTVHKVTGAAAPDLLAADSAGAYFLGFTGGLDHVSPSGAVHKVKYTSYPDSLALAGGRVEILGTHFSGGKAKQYIDSYSASTLARAYSRHISAHDFAIAGTGAGLLMLSCPTSSCSTGTVSRLSTATGATITTAKLPYVTHLVAGLSAAVITDHGIDFSLYRVAT